MLKRITSFLIAFLALATTTVFAQGSSLFGKTIWMRYAEGFGWAIVASLGFSVGVALATRHPAGRLAEAAGRARQARDPHVRPGGGSIHGHRGRRNPEGLSLS